LLSIFLLERKENTIIFLKKILKKLLTTFKAHAIIISPGSERLKGEPGSVGREKPEEKKGASPNWNRNYPRKPGSCQGR
jgi:hypothetical protein